MNQEQDFNVNNYSIEDLLKILDINVPISKEELLEHGKKFIKKYINENQQGYAKFFTEALQKLLKNYQQVEDFLEPSKNSKTEFAENTLTNQYYDDGSIKQKISNALNYRKDNVSVIDENHAIHAQGRLSTQSVHGIPLSQGTINPTLRNVYTSWVNVDSHYREIRKKQSNISCHFNVPDPSGLAIKIVDSSTDFTFNLSEPITNVTALTLGSLEIPMNAYYPVSERYGTNSFDISGVSDVSCVELPSGFYPAFPATTTAPGTWYPTPTTGIPTELLSSHLPKIINDKLEETFGAPNLFLIIINANTQKTSFINNTGSEITIIFYSTNKLKCKPTNCLLGNTGAKIDSNLGWLLGFRQPQYTIPATTGSYITSEDVVNPWGTRYLLLEVDDLNRNRNSGNLISMSSNKDNLKLPMYYNRSRPACAKKGVAGINFTGPGEKKKRPCRTGVSAGTNLIDGSNNLTQAQKYTITEIINRQKTQDQSRYDPPVNTNILYRMPISRSSNNVLTGNETATIIKNDSGLENARRYFGPVDIKTLKVKLLNDKGYPIDLSADWSFSLVAERHYQY